MTAADVDLLRRAAALMRERAEAARAGAWRAEESKMTEGAHVIVAEWASGPRRVATCAGSLPEGNALNAEHIASWHPAVALAVAVLLDNEASLIASTEEYPDLHMPLNGARVDLLLTVARAYLGESS